MLIDGETPVTVICPFVSGSLPRLDKVKLIDARGPRFSAGITTLVLAAALVTQSAVLIAIQLVVFAIGAFAGPAKTPYAFIFKKFVKPRLRGEVLALQIS